MARIVEQERKRGRKAGALRIAARELVAQINASKKAQTVTVEIHPADGKKKADVATFEIPKGTVLVPFELTRGKTDENVRTTVTNGFADVDASPVHSSKTAQDDNGENHTIFLVSLKK